MYENRMILKKIQRIWKYLLFNYCNYVTAHILHNAKLIFYVIYIITNFLLKLNCIFDIYLYKDLKIYVFVFLC